MHKFRFKEILNQNYWHPQSHRVNFVTSRIYKFIYLLFASVKNFKNDNCFLHTATLTYYSILSIVPIIATGFAVAKGFGMESYLYDFVNKPNLNNKDVWLKVVEFANIWLSKTKGSLIAMVGIFVLLYSVFSMIRNIEYAFNDIWKIKNHRNFIRQLTDYLAIMILFPILFIASFSLSVYLQSIFLTVMNSSSITKEIGQTTISVLKIFSFIIIASVFTLSYILITNKKVRFISALYGGIVAGVLFQIFQNFYIIYQIKLTSYNTIYGSFAAIPFFFIWMYYSWAIVLLGSELAMNHEFYVRYKNSNLTLEYNFYQKKILSVIIIYEIVKNFKKANSNPLNENQISELIKISPIKTRDLLNDLIRINLINEIKTCDNIRAFQPAFDVELYTISSILSALDQINFSNSSEQKLVVNCETHQNIRQKIDDFINSTKTLSSNLHISKI